MIFTFDHLPQAFVQAVWLGTLSVSLGSVVCDPEQSRCVVQAFQQVRNYPLTVEPLLLQDTSPIKREAQRTFNALCLVSSTAPKPIAL